MRIYDQGKKTYIENVSKTDETTPSREQKRQKWKILNATEVEERTIKFPWKTINSICEQRKKKFQHSTFENVCERTISRAYVNEWMCAVVVVYYQMHH